QHRLPVRDAVPVTRDVTILDIPTELIDIIEKRQANRITHLLAQLEEPRHGDFLSLIDDDMIDGISELDQLVGTLWDEEVTLIATRADHAKQAVLRDVKRCLMWTDEPDGYAVVDQMLAAMPGTDGFSSACRTDDRCTKGGRQLHKERLRRVQVYLPVPAADFK